jgi:hypothetical protein
MGSRRFMGRRLLLRFKGDFWWVSEERKDGGGLVCWDLDTHGRRCGVEELIFGL